MDKYQNNWILNSIQSCEYLKIDEKNHVHIKEQTNNQIRSISIQQEYEVEDGNTQIYCIFKIRIQNMSLIELLLF